MPQSYSFDLFVMSYSSVLQPKRLNQTCHVTSSIAGGSAIRLIKINFLIRVIVAIEIFVGLMRLA